MTISTSLSRRGHELASGLNIRDRFKNVVGDPYDPDTNPDGFISIGVAENYAMCPMVTEYVNSNLHVTKQDFTYGEGPWGTERLRKAMAKYMTKHFNAIEPIHSDDLLFANGVTSLCEMLGFSLGDPGDAILYSSPIYQAFQIDFGTKAKIGAVHTHFGDVDQFSPEAVELYEKALLGAEKEGIHIRALMLCNPHNPLGRCYPKETIIGLMKLCNKYKIHLLCDEIYAASVYEVPDKHALPFTSVLSFDFSEYISRNYVHVLYGMSKDFAAGGARLGCFYSRNKELIRAMSAITQFHWSGAINERAAILILENDEWLDKFHETARKKLSDRNKLTRSLLEDAGVKFVPGANAGFFLWIDLRPYLPPADQFEDKWEREDALAEKLMKAKVYLTNGKMLAAEEPGWFRVIFSQDEIVIKTGLERVFKCLGIKK